VAAEWVTFECDGERVDGYVGSPQGCMLFGAVVAAPDEIGVSEHLQEQTRRLAAEGFVTLTIDLFAGRRGETGAARVLQSGLDYLASRLDVDADCIGALGYGRGGDAVLTCSSAPNKLACAVVFHAPPGSGVRRSGAACPMQLHYWEDDAEIPFEEAVAFKQSLERDRAKLIEFHAYPGARCSDLDFGAEASAPEACALAVRRMTGFFHRYLGDWTAA
jgi:carboxymethylenebutenolidase